MIKSGLLDKYGKKNEKTPKDWISAYHEYQRDNKEETETPTTVPESSKVLL